MASTPFVAHSLIRAFPSASFSTRNSSTGSRRGMKMALDMYLSFAVSLRMSSSRSMVLLRT